MPDATERVPSHGGLRSVVAANTRDGKNFLEDVLGHDGFWWAMPTLREFTGDQEN